MYTLREYLLKIFIPHFKYLNFIIISNPKRLHSLATIVPFRLVPSRYLRDLGMREEWG